MGKKISRSIKENQNHKNLKRKKKPETNKQPNKKTRGDKKKLTKLKNKKPIHQAKKFCGVARDFLPSPSSNLDRGRSYSTPKPFENNLFNNISRLELATARCDPGSAARS